MISIGLSFALDIIAVVEAVSDDVEIILIAIRAGLGKVVAILITCLMHCIRS